MAFIRRCIITLVAVSLVNTSKQRSTMNIPAFCCIFIAASLCTVSAASVWSNLLPPLSSEYSSIFLNLIVASGVLKHNLARCKCDDSTFFLNCVFMWFTIHVIWGTQRLLHSIHAYMVSKHLKDRSTLWFWLTDSVTNKISWHLSLLYIKQKAHKIFR